MVRDEDFADLQAQVVALRLAVEGAWLSLLQPDVDPAAAAKRLGAQNIAAIGQLDAKTDAAEAVRAAVVRHTEQLWGSIAWQLGESNRDETA